MISLRNISISLIVFLSWQIAGAEQLSNIKRDLYVDCFTGKECLLVASLSGDLRTYEDNEFGGRVEVKRIYRSVTVAPSDFPLSVQPAAASRLSQMNNRPLTTLQNEYKVIVLRHLLKNKIEEAKESMKILFWMN